MRILILFILSTWALNSQAQQLQNQAIENSIIINQPAKVVWNYIKGMSNLPTLVPDGVDKIEINKKG